MSAVCKPAGAQRRSVGDGDNGTNVVSLAVTLLALDMASERLLI